jgi:hypothetical protein
VISRQYVVLMPNEESTTPIDILVQNNPGSQAAPVVAGGDGAYYEWRGRPLRIPNPSTVAASYVQRFRLGFLVGLLRINNSIVTDLPGVQFSASLAKLSSTDAGPTISVPAFADPAGGPSIRLIGGAGTAGGIFVLTLSLPEPKDEDRDPTGQG